MNEMIENKEEIILVDVDGPCGLFDETILPAVTSRVTIQHLRDSDDWDFFKLFNKEEMKTCHMILEDHQFWRNIPPNEPAQKAVEKMKVAGGKVIFLTSPWESCREWDHARRDWLKRHFGAKGRDDVIITSAKHLVYGDIFIDDRLSNIQSWHKHWKKHFPLKEHEQHALLFETHTNFRSDWYPRIVVRDDKWKILEKKEG